jgi:hypothetical protein
MHAIKRMRQRDITRAEIQEALADRGKVTHPSEDHPDRVVILGRTEAGRPLKVVVDRLDHEHVITVARRDEEI